MSLFITKKTTKKQQYTKKKLKKKKERKKKYGMGVGEEEPIKKNKKIKQYLLKVYITQKQNKKNI